MSEELTLEDIPGIGRITARKLRNAGIFSVRQLAMYTTEELADLGIEENRAIRILRAARRAVRQKALVLTAVEHEKLMKSFHLLTTGVKAIDDLLGGGLEPQSIYELAGEFGSGKTQICHQLAVTVQLTPNRGGVDGKAMYIDTEGTFSLQRICSIAKRFGIDLDHIKENILVARPMNVEDLEELVRGELVKYVEEGVKLIVVDSIIALYRAEFKGREMLARRQQRINYLLDWLKRIGKIYNTYTVITNQVLDRPLGFGPVVKVPTGGNIIAHASTHRLYLKREGDVWKLEVLDSPRMPRKASVCFRITDVGVEDV